MDRNIATEWASFERLILDPIQASPLQRLETRRAFYAGAAAMFTLVNEATAGEHEEVCMAQLSLLCEELDEFTTQLKTGNA